MITYHGLFPYSPVKALPPIFAVAFLLCGIIILYQYFTKYKWRRYTIVMSFTCLVWAAGFCLRMGSIYHNKNLSLFVGQYALLFTGPPLFAGSEYFILGRLMAYLPYHTPIHPGRVLSTFIMLDTIVEALGINGAIAQGLAKTLTEKKSGLARQLAALSLQSALEIGFFSLVAVAEIRCRNAGMFPRNVRMICYLLYVTSAMMLVRCIFRIVEAVESMDCALHEPVCGTVDRHEWFFYVFEVANILLFVILLVSFPPGRYLSSSHRVYLHPVDGTERTGPGFSKADKRPFWVTVLDPFNIKGILTGKGMVMEQFWEQDNPVYRRDGVVPQIREQDIGLEAKQGGIVHEQQKSEAS